MTRTLISAVTFIVAAIVLSSAALTFADHSWGGYHWARTSNPFVLKLGDSVTSTWDSYLDTSVSDWSASSVLDVTKVAGANASSPRNCKSVAGRGEVCNAKYGFNGWLGIASVWISGSHITQGTVKLNDTYFNYPTYNTPAWRNLVMCQEIGHIFGLDHQDETNNNANLGTCMDYTNSPASNQHPNAHDFVMLETIYGHNDTSTTVSQTAAAKFQDTVSEDPKAWGKEVRKSQDGSASLFERDLGNGKKVLTHVFWAESVDHSHESKAKK